MTWEDKTLSNRLTVNTTANSSLKRPANNLAVINNTKHRKTNKNVKIFSYWSVENAVRNVSILIKNDSIIFNSNKIQ